MLFASYSLFFSPSASDRPCDACKHIYHSSFSAVCFDSIKLPHDLRSNWIMLMTLFWSNHSIWIVSAWNVQNNSDIFFLLIFLHRVCFSICFSASRVFESKVPGLNSALHTQSSNCSVRMKWQSEQIILTSEFMKRNVCSCS